MNRQACRLNGYLWIALAAAVVTSRLLVGAEIELGATKDNTLYEDASGLISNGAGAYLFAGTTMTSEIRRAVLAFDVAGAIPAGSTVQSARLSLRMSKTISGGQPVTLHRLSSDWGEGTSDAPASEGAGISATDGDATWIHAFFDQTSWSTAGGDFVEDASATAPVGSVGRYTWGTTVEMVADVQQWLDSPDLNFGWILVGEEEEDGTAKRFGSRENPAADEQPRLIIEYAPPLTEFVRGDANADSNVDISDAVAVLNYLFLGDGAPSCLKSADVDDNDAVELTDAVRLLNHLFLGGAEPPSPFRDCGADPTPGALTCEDYDVCG